MLTFLAGPGVYVFACLFTDIARRRVDPSVALRRLGGLAAALILGLAIAGVWYWPHRTDFLGAMRSVTSLDTTRQPLLAPASLMYYVNAMPWNQMGLPLFALFLYGLARFGSRVSAEHRTFLIVWMGSIYLIHTLGTFKATHNDIGILLPAAVISATGVASLGNLADTLPCRPSPVSWDCRSRCSRFRHPRWPPAQERSAGLATVILECMRARERKTGG